MKSGLITITALLLPLGILAFLNASPPDHLPTSHVGEWHAMNASKTDSFEWFEDSKFGMFIHWGLYSVPAGVWEGKKIHNLRPPSVAEWIQYSAEIPRKEYAELAKGFYPVNWDADQVAALAKQAGARYVVITTKHHDGFAMYDSKVSEFDIIDATPFKRDVVKELYNACKKVGLEFGVYYSQNIDWADGSDCRVSEYEENGWSIEHKTLSFGANTWDPSPNTFEEYLEKKAFPQVEEIMENFPDMKLFWYDMSWRMDPETSYDFYKIVYEHQPQVLINQRIGSGFGDYSIPGDNKIPDNLNALLKPWETVGTFNNSWGFNGYDQDWKSPKEILYWLFEIVSKGGNYMLNIGPTGLGGIPQESVENLETVGAWLVINGEAIYGTKKWVISKEGPTELKIGGTNHRKEEGFTKEFTTEDFWFTQKDSTVYAISLASPEESVIVKSLDSKIGVIQAVEILGIGEVNFSQTEEGLKVFIPQGLKTEIAYVIKVKL